MMAEWDKEAGALSTKVSVSTLSTVRSTKTRPIRKIGFGFIAKRKSTNSKTNLSPLVMTIITYNLKKQTRKILKPTSKAKIILLRTRLGFRVCTWSNMNSGVRLLTIRKVACKTTLKEIRN